MLIADISPGGGGVGVEGVKNMTAAARQPDLQSGQPPLNMAL